MSHATASKQTEMSDTIQQNALLNCKIRFGNQDKAKSDLFRNKRKAYFAVKNIFRSDLDFTMSSDLIRQSGLSVHLSVCLSICLPATSFIEVLCSWYCIYVASIIVAQIIRSFCSHILQFLIFHIVNVLCAILQIVQIQKFGIFQHCLQNLLVAIAAL